MDRRDFIRQIGLGLLAGWAFGRLSWPSESLAAGPELRLALLADAHLKNGDGRCSEAQTLARAVAEINALAQPPDLVLFAGDLAHKGRPDALNLGREILSDLASPLWAVRGEGDLGRGGPAPWVRRFGSPCFSRAFQGVHFLGLDTALADTPYGPAFKMGAVQRQWLAQELARLDSATPLVIVSHAPLARLYHPWQQWTGDASEIAPLLARFRQVLCLHGHTHVAEFGNAGVRSEGSGIRGKLPPTPPLAKGGMAISHLSAQREWSESPPLKKGDLGGFSETWVDCPGFEPFQGRTGNRKPETENRLFSISLPSTAWPRPQAMQGTPAILRTGLGPRGCGWALITMQDHSWHILTNMWQA